MFRPRLKSVFASRWKALWWSLSVLVSAWLIVPREGEDNDGGAAQLAAQFLPGTPTAAPSPRSPWAPDQPATAE